MARYVLLLRDEYYPRAPQIHLSGTSGVELLGPGSVSSIIVSQGDFRSGPFNWCWAVVDYDAAKELTPDTNLHVFPLLGNGIGPVGAVPFRLGPRLRNAPFGCSSASNCRISTSTTRRRGRNLSLTCTRIVG